MGASQSELADFPDPGPAVTPERILAALRNHEARQDVEITELKDSAGNVKGEGFMSSLACVSVEARVGGEARSYRWMVKSIPREPSRGCISLKMMTDERERFFLAEFLPRLRCFLVDKGEPELLGEFCPVPYSAWTETEKVLIMDDLRVSGWRDAINKMAGLDISHVRAAVRWLAALHAATFAYLEQYPGGVEQARRDLPLLFWRMDQFWDVERDFADIREMGNKQLLELFRGFEQQDKEYVKYLEDIIKEHMDMGTAAMKVKDDREYKLKTICHGDPWFNNMMFRYIPESNKPSDVVFIDFQLAGYASPATDLVYFLAASTTGELRRQHWHHILTLYHTTFTIAAARLGVTPDFSYEDLENDVKKARLHGINFALNALPAILNENKDDIIDTEEWMDALNSQDPEEKEKNMAALLEKNRATVDANAGMGERMRDLLDEYIEAGDFPPFV